MDYFLLSKAKLIFFVWQMKFSIFNNLKGSRFNKFINNRRVENFPYSYFKTSASNNLYVKICKGNILNYNFLSSTHQNLIGKLEMVRKCCDLVNTQCKGPFKTTKIMFEFRWILKPLPEMDLNCTILICLIFLYSGLYKTFPLRLIKLN